MSTERNGSAAAESWRGQFGGCDCRQGRDVCNCGMSNIRPIEPDLPINRWTALAAVIAVALAAVLSSFFKLGFAS